jgi:hypothetical protein
MIEQASLIIGDGNWAVKSDGLLGYKINNGKYYPRDMTFTRATTGTRVNEAGLVELVPYNLLGYTNELNGWNLLNSSRTTGQNNPFGSNDAIKLTYNTTNGAHYIFRGAPSIGQVTISIYAKASELNFLQIASAQTTEEYANFNLSTGVVGTKGTRCSSSLIENVGDGWYRCTATLINGTNSVYFCIVNSASSSWFGSSGYAGANNTDGLLLWGAQLVEGTEPLDYLPTTDRLDIPRIDYSTGEPALLVEPQRTNLILYSQDISNAAWTKSSGGTGSTPIVTANYTASPLEGKMADRVIFNLNGGTASADLSTLQSFSFNLTLGDNVTYYMAVKTNDGSTVNMTLNNNLGLSEVKSITPEWTIIKTSTTATSTSSGVLRLRLRGSEAVSDYADISVAYAQLEIGSYQTSYIPTTTASVTRNADVCVKTGISSLINSTEGVLYFEGSALSNDLTQRAISLSDGSNTNRVCLLYNDSSNAIRLFIQVGGSTQSSIISTSYTITDSNKIAIKWKENDFALWINGVEVGTDNSGVSFTSNTLNTLDFSFPNDTTFFYGNVKQVLTFNTALSDEELATLTTI